MQYLIAPKQNIFSLGIATKGHSSHANFARESSQLGFVPVGMTSQLGSIPIGIRPNWDFPIGTGPTSQLGRYFVNRKISLIDVLPYA